MKREIIYGGRNNIINNDDIDHIVDDNGSTDSIATNDNYNNSNNLGRNCNINSNNKILIMIYSVYEYDGNE